MEELRDAVRHSWCVVSVYDDGQLVGSGRAVSDGVCHALIVDVIVSPSHQGRGLGTAIMQQLLERCRASNLRDVQLFCASGKAPFYTRLGFVCRPDDAPGMDWQRGSRES